MTDNPSKLAVLAAAQARPANANGHNVASSSTDPSRTMSASPFAAASTTPNGAVPKNTMRRRPKANPLVQAKRPVRKRPRPETSAPNANGASSATDLSDPIYKEQPVVIPVFASKKSLVDGFRYHAMRLQSKDRLDLYDQTQFTHPIRLHRRDPRAGPNSGGAEAVDEETPENPEDTKERERLELLKEQRRKQREENQAQIAPSLKPSKPNAFQKKTEQVFRTNDTPEARKRAAIRYEEAVPWHLEDFDNKNTWVGSYEAALSECFMMLIEHEGGFRMVPVEKWYKFSNKARGKTWTAEEADAAYATKLRPAEYMIQRQALDMQREAKLKERSQDRKMFVGKREDDLGRFKGGEFPERENVEDGNDLDYNVEDDFADDEEGVNGLFEGDEEEQKDTKNKIQQEQLAANVFGMTQEEHVWKREEEERKRREEEAKLKKRTNKLMRKHEHNYLYEDDTDGENPYSSSSESEEEAEEEQGEDRQKQDEQGKGKEPEKANQQPSGTSTKGTNTPSGRPKHSDPTKKPTTTLGKRPGSPNLSEASGNESAARKKTKKKHGTQSTSTAPPSRPMSPELVAPSTSSTAAGLASRPGSFISLGRGAGSDSEGTDTGRAQKLKIRVGSPTGTPGGSRAGSPAAPGASSGTNIAPGAKLKSISPGATPPASATSANGASELSVTREEVLAAIPQDVGIEMKELLKKFRHRVKPTDQKAFVAMVKGVVRFDKATSRIYRR